MCIRDRYRTESVSFHLKYWLKLTYPLLLARRMLSVLQNDVMSKILCGELHSERSGCRHSMLQLHGLFGLAELLSKYYSRIMYILVAMKTFGGFDTDCIHPSVCMTAAVNVQLEAEWWRRASLTTQWNSILVRNSTPNNAFIDIRLRPGIATQLSMHRHMAHCGQTWRHR